jgi:hypothetical protein
VDRLKPEETKRETPDFKVSKEEPPTPKRERVGLNPGVTLPFPKPAETENRYSFAKKNDYIHKKESSISENTKQLPKPTIFQEGTKIINDCKAREAKIKNQ